MDIKARIPLLEAKISELQPKEAQAWATLNATDAEVAKIIEAARARQQEVLTFWTGLYKELTETRNTLEAIRKLLGEDVASQPEPAAEGSVG